jgi:DNA-binding transcriptional MerR regulator
MRQRRSTELPIGALAKAAGTKVQTVRYYEQIGLLPAPARTEGGQRIYGAKARDRLAFIRHARELGFGLDAIRALLSLADRPDLDCAAADRIAQEHLDAVRERIARLRGLEAELVRMVEQCAHGKVADCRVIESLADHGHAGCAGSKGEARVGALGAEAR